MVALGFVVGHMAFNREHGRIGKMPDQSDGPLGVGRSDLWSLRVNTDSPDHGELLRILRDAGENGSERVPRAWRSSLVIEAPFACGVALRFYGNGRFAALRDARHPAGSLCGKGEQRTAGEIFRLLQCTERPAALAATTFAPLTKRCAPSSPIP